MARDLILEPWQWADLFTYHYKNYKPTYYFPVDLPWSQMMRQVTYFLLGLWALGLIFDARAQIPSTENEGHGLRRFVLTKTKWIHELGVSWSRLFDDKRHVGNGFFVSACLIGAMVVGLFGSQVYFNRLSQHWSQRWLFQTYESLKEPGEPLIAYQMNWRGETFYGANHDRQAKKNDQLKLALKKPGRKFILTETKRLKGLKKALGKEKAKTLKIVDRSNKKWYLVMVE